MSLPHLRTRTSQPHQRSRHRTYRQRLYFYRNVFPERQQAGLQFPVVSYANEFSRLRCYELFLVEACATTFNAVEVVVDFVCAVEGDVDEGVGGEGVEF